MRKDVVVGLSLVLLVACDRGGGGSSPVTVPSLQASPDSFAPGAAVLLTPTFLRGTARIDPDIGPVESGRTYPVGPSVVGRVFTLTITTEAGVETRVLGVPFRYRERVDERQPSAVARTYAGCTLLASGRLLLVGGSSPGPTFWSSSETLEPTTLAFSAAGDLSTTRRESVIVPEPDGSAWSFGGPINDDDFEKVRRVEQWDAATATWTVRGHLICNRFRHTATRLADGRILLIGGFATGPAADRDAEVWVPGVGARPANGDLLRRRAGHTATLLADGHVLVIGGTDLDTGAALAVTERIDPATETSSQGGGLQRARTNHAAVMLADGRVLVIGGEDANGPIDLCEVFDPQTGSFAPAGVLATPRSEAPAVRLADGRVLVAGGAPADALATDSIEVWSPADGTWRAWPTRLPRQRVGHVLQVLHDGRVLIVGGDDGNGFPLPLCCVLD